MKNDRASHYNNITDASQDAGWAKLRAAIKPRTKRTKRITRICQDCWEALRPTEYFPSVENWDTCARCRGFGLTARVARAEVVAARPGGEFETLLAGAAR